MQSENPPISKAVLELPSHMLQNVYSSLSRGSGIQGTRAVLDLLLLPGRRYAPRSYTHVFAAAEFVDRYANGAPFADIETFVSAPVQWRDVAASEVQTALIRLYFRDLIVDLDPLLDSTGCLQAIHDARALKSDQPSAQETESNQSDVEDQDVRSKAVLEALEPAHRLVVLYLWLSWRLPLAFRDQDAALTYKREIETLITFILGQLRSQSSVSVATREEDIAASKTFEWEHESFQNSAAWQRPMAWPRTTETHLPF